jgi:hypothetical protein
VQVLVRDLQKGVRPLLYHVAYARAASESDFNDPNISASLARQDGRATEYCKQYVEAYLKAYMKSSAAGEAYLTHMQEAAKLYLQRWRDKVSAAQQARDAHLKMLNTVAAGLQTLKSAGMISVAILTFIAPAAAKPLSLAFTGVDIYSDAEKQSNSHAAVLVVTKDVAKEVGKKALEEAPKLASEHLAEYVEAKATETWLETLAHNPWCNVSPATGDLLNSLNSAESIQVSGKVLGNAVGTAFTAYDVVQQLKENYEAWKTAFEGEGAEQSELRTNPGTVRYNLPFMTP